MAASVSTWVCKGFLGNRGGSKEKCHFTDGKVEDGEAGRFAPSIIPTTSPVPFSLPQTFRDNAMTLGSASRTVEAFFFFFKNQNKKCRSEQINKRSWVLESSYTEVPFDLWDKVQIYSMTCKRFPMLQDFLPFMSLCYLNSTMQSVRSFMFRNLCINGLWTASLGSNLWPI